jgi:6-pyruvoyltetrahydropterin/6-carboxytetrahydropterin synthase
MRDHIQPLLDLAHTLTRGRKFRASLWTLTAGTPTLANMSTAYLTRRIRFAAAHRYYRDDWSVERNRQVFGPCSNEHGHGHGYRLEVTVAAVVDAETGFSVDLAVLDRLLHEEVVEPLDHQHLNHAVDVFRTGVIPTTENILIWLWPRILRRLPQPARLHRLRLYEDDDLYVDYFGGATHD